MNRREFVGAALASPLARAEAAAARFRMPESFGERLRSLQVCDLSLRMIPTTMDAAGRETRFTPPERPFRVGLLLPVAGFGTVYLYADNRGRGYTAGDFASGQALPLDHEFAADRLATVRNYLETCRREGVSVSAAAQKRIESSAALLEKPAFMESLRDSLWAGEMLVFERAQHAISKRGPRPGFLFGANAFGVRKGKDYTGRFEAIFNYATVPFYRGSVEAKRDHRNYSHAESVLDWLEKTSIIRKGHPLVWFVGNSTPEWMQKPPMPFDEARLSAMDYARSTVQKFRGRIHAWDVINEAHVQNALNFTEEQLIDLTAAAARAAREGDPTCFRVINSCSTWGDYMTRKQGEGRQNVYDYLRKVKDAGVDFEAIGLQYYYAQRDLLENERSIETFKDFGKPVHITELGLASAPAEANEFKMRAGVAWHGGEWNETTQADWIEQFYTMAYSKPYIEAITWWDLADPAFIPNGGLLHQDMTPKESYTRLERLIKTWSKGQ